jgi:hypothetical protein
MLYSQVILDQNNNKTKNWCVQIVAAELKFTKQNRVACGIFAMQSLHIVDQRPILSNCIRIFSIKYISHILQVYESVICE